LPKLIELKRGNETILVEATDVQGEGIVQAAGSMEKNLDPLIAVVRPLSESLIEALQSLERRPNSISAEFGLSFNLEGNIYVVKASGEASLKVTLTWNAND
jgi:hypothetical protein